MMLFHISHTDLDGYGCQLLTQEFFKKGLFLNANYGLEVKLSISKVIDEIKALPMDEEILFLISDVNLTLNEAKDLDKRITALKESGYKIELQLLDHHATGQKSADLYDWYFLDIKRCATKIVYDYMVEKFDAYDKETNAWLETLVNAINAVDIWLDHEEKNFEFGKVLLSMVSKAREVNNILFAEQNRDYRIYLLKKSAQYLSDDRGYIQLDSDLHSLKKEYLKLDENDNTIDNLSAKYLVNLLDSKKDELTVYYKGHKGLLTYTLGSISIPANAFLKSNTEYDFFIDIGKKGHTSLRADGKVDVSYLAAKMANGGGHINASGCKFDDFKETIDYNVVKSYIQERLKRCE